MSSPKRHSGEDEPGFRPNPFEALSSADFPPASERSSGEVARRLEGNPVRKNRGRVDIIRQKAGRGGKTVTIVKSFVGIGLPEKEQLAKAMQKTCGTGGTVSTAKLRFRETNARKSRAS